jgi:hypothetical protein
MMHRWFVAIAAVGVLAATAGGAKAGPVSVSFSYTFQSGETLSGVVEGNLRSDGVTVGDLKNLHATYSGQPGTELTYLPGDAFHPTLSLIGASPFLVGGFESDAQTADAQSNFGFMFLRDSSTDVVAIGTFRTRSSQIDFPSSSDAMELEDWNSSAFTASAVAVPEPSSIAMGVLGATGAAVGMRRRRARKA